MNNPPRLRTKTQALIDDTHTTLGPLAVDAVEAARLLSVSPRTIHTMKQRGEIPFVKVGSRVVYPVSHLTQWLEEQVLQNKKPATGRAL